MTKNINALPSLTWNWLKMNHADIDGISYPADIEKQTSMVFLASDKGNEPTALDFTFVDQKRQAVSVVLEEDASQVCLMDMKNQKAAITSGVSFSYQLKKGASLTLVQVFRLGKDDVFFSEIDGTIEENASFHLIQLFLGGKKVFMEAKNALVGKAAKLDVDSAYLLTDEQVLDMNYIADHTGKKTECRMKTDGVLRDHAKKIYRGTIDFKNGCAGAIGNETEDVLMMDESVENKSIPIILCAEEDVEGNHGATIGKLDESLLFYLQSRGMEEDEIYEMMANARIEAVVKLIPNESLRRELLEQA